MAWTMLVVIMAVGDMTVVSTKDREFDVRPLDICVAQVRPVHRVGPQGRDQARAQLGGAPGQGPRRASTRARSSSAWATPRTS